MIRPDTMARLGCPECPPPRWPPAPKALAALALVITLAAWREPPPTFLAGTALVLVGAAARARLSWRFFAVRLLVLSPLIFSLATLSLTAPGGWRWGVLLAGKSLLCLTTALLYAGTTPFSSTLALLRRLRMPSLLITTLALAYRYSFVLTEEARRMEVARKARCFTPAKRREAAWRATLLGRLFLRSMDRSGRVYAAMQARGWR
ncbi:MAG: hypothetical protein IT578_01430 [Verrucomicrobiae bacterium]|nr:hypothetical protein [Verrucomicrobiae bacterium]